MAIAVFFDYVTWLYSGGVREYFRAWGNFHWFLFHFFSTGIMFSTLFSPWHRLNERPVGRGLDIGGFFERAVINCVLRTVGFAVRSIFIAISVICQATLLFGGLIILAVFLLSPIILPLMFISGISLILL